MHNDFRSNQREVQANRTDNFHAFPNTPGEQPFEMHQQAKRDLLDDGLLSNGFTENPLGAIGTLPRPSKVYSLFDAPTRNSVPSMGNPNESYNNPVNGHPPMDYGSYVPSRMEYPVEPTNNLYAYGNDVHSGGQSLEGPWSNLERQWLLYQMAALRQEQQQQQQQASAAWQGQPRAVYQDWMTQSGQENFNQLNAGPPPPPGITSRQRPPNPTRENDASAGRFPSQYDPFRSIWNRWDENQ